MAKRVIGRSREIALCVTMAIAELASITEPPVATLEAGQRNRPIARGRTRDKPRLYKKGECRLEACTTIAARKNSHAPCLQNRHFLLRSLAA